VPRWNNSRQTHDEVQRLKREAVLKEAGRAFSRKGYHNTSLDDVAKALQVSKGTLYNYVKDKQEILFECQKLACDIGDRAFAHARERGGSGAQMLRNVLSHYIELITSELGSCAVLMEVDALRPEDRETVVAHRDGFERSFVVIMKAGIRDGTLRNVDPKLAVFTFMGAVNWVPRWYTPDGRLTGSVIAEKMTDILMAGLTPSPIESKPTIAAKTEKAAKTVKSRVRVAA
jgi:AcrR family transcriptional regulator